MRRALGFRECSVEDAEKLTEWPAGQEMILACLRILQSAPAYVNTLMLQDVLDDPTCVADSRSLTPL